MSDLVTVCPAGDRTCPCQDGDVCHYRPAGASPALPHRPSADRYVDAMDRLAAAYKPITDAILERLNLRACTTQTGGMCGAIEITIEGGYLLITDFEDTLSWDPQVADGWWVGRYLDDGDGEVHYDGNPDMLGSETKTIDTLIPLIEQALRAPKGTLT